jgi:Fe-Mn family superoxide dismutase
MKTTLAVSRRVALQSIAAAALTRPLSAATFTLPPLPYALDALEPHIDARTMELHHGRHHQAYVDNLNKAIAGDPKLAQMTVEDLLTKLDSLPPAIRTAVRNHGGGHANHTLFWKTMAPKTSAPKGPLAKAIDESFGSYAAFQGALKTAAMGVFGSGWAWVVMEPSKRLLIESYANQDSPLTRGRQPLLGLDVWEHAYYLKYQNRRADYLTAWFNVVNWDFTSQRYEELAR